MHYIFVHGLGQTEKSWDDVISNLASEPVHCPNLQGLLNDQEITYKKLYNRFQEYCNGFCEPLHLCGLSLGGILALNYAIEFPDKVSSLVLIGTQYKMPKGLLKLQNFVFRFMPNSLFDGMGFDKNNLIGLTNSMPALDFTNSLSDIVCKALIICGEKDRANQKAAMDLSQKLKDAKLVFIENSKHEVNVENPKGLSQALNRFYHEIS